MPQFTYVALDAQGQQVTGSIEAASQNEAVGQLRQSGYYPTAVDEASKAGRSKSKAITQQKAAAPSVGAKSGLQLFKKTTIKSKTLMIFTRQLATLIDAGLPLLRSLTVLAKQEKDPVLKETIVQLADSVQGGSTFSDSLSTHPKLFNKLYINMVKAGEMGGVLELVLVRLAEFQEKAHKIKNKVVSAMFYPITVLVIAVAILVFLLAYIVPKFEQIFADMLGGKPLPALTQFVIGASNLVKDNMPALIGGIIVLVIGYKLISRTEKGIAVLDAIKLKAPLFGDLIRKSSISRFSRRPAGV